MRRKTMIRFTDVRKRYYIGKPNELEILHGIDLEIQEGEFVSIVGASGSGKSTMMNIIGMLDRPTEGKYLLDGMETEKLKDKELSAIRNKKIGFIFQTYNLISRTSALKNVELPMLYFGLDGKTRNRRAKELLNMVGMGERIGHRPDELSGGQKQRVAIARAMANDPAVILADEPTGNIDPELSYEIVELLEGINQCGTTILMVTHEHEMVRRFGGRIVTIDKGTVARDERLRKDGDPA